MTVDQLDDEVLNLKKERFNLRFQRATGQLENTSRLREARRDIARIKTIARQKRDSKKSKEEDLNAEADAAGHRGERQFSRTRPWSSRVERRFTHPVLKKTVRRSKKYHAHDENNEYSVGDIVWLEEHRPISKLKRWTVVRGEKQESA